MSRSCRILACLLPLLALAGCSDDAPSVPPRPPEPVSAQTAFRGMFASARAWAADAQPLRVAQIDVEGMEAEGGKAPAWEALFVSAGRRQIRRYVYSIVHRPARNLRGGINDEPPETWSGEGGVEPFPVQAFKKDSTAAWEVARQHGRDYARQHLGQPVRFLLEKTDRFPDPAWRVYWGSSVSASGYSVFVDAATGAYLGTVR